MARAGNQSELSLLVTECCDTLHHFYVNILTSGPFVPSCQKQLRCVHLADLLDDLCYRGMVVAMGVINVKLHLGVAAATQGCPL